MHFTNDPWPLEDIKYFFCFFSEIIIVRHVKYSRAGCNVTPWKQGYLAAYGISQYGP